MKYVVDEPSRLELSVFMPDVAIPQLISEAVFNITDVFKESATSEEDEFGSQLLYSIIDIIRVKHPYVKTVLIHDSLIYTKGITVDTMLYNIALYGKTWYERKANAYLETPHQEIYEAEIERYRTLIPRNTFPFRYLYEKMVKNVYTHQILYSKLEEIEHAYNTSVSFPEFFTHLRSIVPKEERCRFFKDWLEGFIESQITIRREWRINIPSCTMLDTFKMTVFN
jgi:hypothetical protein